MPAPPISSSDPVHIGIDFGGTKIFGALVGPGGGVSDETYVEHGRAIGTGAQLSPEEVALGPAYARLGELASALCERARAQGRTPAGIGIGAPGVVGPGGVVIAAGSLGWRNVPLGALLERRLGLPVQVENDVNLAALGEQAVGAGRGAGSMFLLAIGTGIGGATVIDGKLWRGAHDSAGEIGGLLPGPEFMGWNDNSWGAFEAYASGTGIGAEAKKAAAGAGVDLPPEALRGDRLFAAAADGAPWARKVIDRAVDLWTVAIGAVQVILDPDLIVLSGGVSKSAAGFIPEIVARLRRSLPQAPTVVPSTLGYRAGVLGAPSLFR